MNARDWLHVSEHCDALAVVLESGRLGETYNIGGGCEMRNIELVGMLCDMVDRRIACDRGLAERFPDCPPARRGRCRELVTFVPDRPGHDRRYAICADKIARQLGFRPRTAIEQGLAATVDWYLANESWWRPIQSGQYRDWMRQQYGMAT